MHTRRVTVVTEVKKVQDYSLGSDNLQELLFMEHIDGAISLLLLPLLLFCFVFKEI